MTFFVENTAEYGKEYGAPQRRKEPDGRIVHSLGGTEENEENKRSAGCEFDDKDAHEEECFLRSFDIDEESKFAQMFFVAQNRHGIDAPAKKPFLCFLEDWEDPSGKALSDMKNRVAQFKLVEKYDGMFLYDDDEDEHRKIANVEWANRKGYQVVT